MSLHTPHHTNHTTPHTHTNHNHTQRQRQRYTTTHNDEQPTNLQLHSTQHRKTHQVQTQQGLTDCSLFLDALMVLHGRFFSVDGVICLVTSFHERHFSLPNHVKYDAYLITSQRDLSRTHPKHNNYSFYFSDMPINNYMTITVTVFFFFEAGYWHLITILMTIFPLDGNSPRLDKHKGVCFTRRSIF